MNELVSFGGRPVVGFALGGCPVIRPEGIYYDGRRVIRLGLSAPGTLGDVGDLLAYRQMWEPFIQAHLDLWRDLNNRFENAPDQLAWCPKGNFTNDQLKNLDPVPMRWCANLLLTRQMVSPTDPGGIIGPWNAWKDSSSAQMITGAAQMLKWHQDVVLRVGGPDKDRLVEIAKYWGIELKLPPLPTFSTQEELIARIQGAYISTKGILQILGYGPAESLIAAADVAQATAQGLKDTAAELPKTTRWVGIAVGVTAVIVGGVLIAYYVPRQPRRKAA